MKKAYCKQHECFDSCAGKVSKKMDDGIHHLTSVERIKSSPEDRVGWLSPIPHTGKRKLDGTPRTGADESLSHKINDSAKAGKAGSRTRVGNSGIREVSKADQTDPFEVSKGAGTTDVAATTKGKKVEAPYPPEVKAYIADHSKVSKSDELVEEVSKAGFGSIATKVAGIGSKMEGAGKGLLSAGVRKPGAIGTGKSLAGSGAARAGKFTAANPNKVMGGAAIAGGGAGAFSLGRGTAKNKNQY